MAGQSVEIVQQRKDIWEAGYRAGRADIEDAVRALADRFDGYGHGVYSTHLEEQLPCSVCALLGDLRSLLVAPTEPPGQESNHE